MRKATIIPGAMSVLLCAGAVALMPGCVGETKSTASRADEPERSVSFRELRCSAVVQRIEAGEFSPGRDGAVKLPPEARELAVDGRAYVSHRPDGKVFVFFPISLKGAAFEGALYVSRPLDDSDVETRPGSRYTIRAVNGPCGAVDIDIKLELRPDWLLVRRTE